MLNTLKRYWLPLQLSLILSAGLVCGCKSDWPGQTATAQVHGTILLDGDPVNQAYVVFVPENLQNSELELMNMAFGTTDADGKFELAYSDGTTELFAGTYTVMVSKVNSPDGDSDNSVAPWSSAILPDSVAHLSSFNQNGETIPSIYNRDSTLSFEVEASPSILRHKFELSSVDPLLRELSETDSDR